MGRCNTCGALLVILGSALGAPLAAQPGNANLVVADIATATSFGSSAGVAAYAYSYTACNAGSMELDWVANTNQHPVFSNQLYRFQDGRFEQIGLSWAHHGFAALAANFCGGCQPSANVGALGIGCSTSSGAALVGAQTALGPRSEINPASASFPFPPGGAAVMGLASRRLQAAITDVDPAQNSGALYFAEVLTLHPDDAAAGNAGDNARHRPVSFGPAPSYPAQLTGGSTPGPALLAWQALDPIVSIVADDLAGDGSFWLGYRVTDLGNGEWAYEYALYNQTSQLSAQAFSVPIGSATVSGIGFHDVDHHSGEPYSGTDWSDTVAGGAVTWSTELFANDPNANALRWGTLYNYRFVADSPPVASTATITHFLSAAGQPTSRDIVIEAPAASGISTEFVRGDTNGNLTLALNDAILLLNFLFGGGSIDCEASADTNDNGAAALNDAVLILSHLFAMGAPPTSPYPDCGPDPTPDLGCTTPPNCP